jgi:hypothetical protein
MYSHILKQFFPMEIVVIILYYIKQTEAKEIIKHYTNQITNKAISIKFVINKLVNSYNILNSVIDNYKETYKNIWGDNEIFIFHLQRVVNSNYSREKYNNTFWQYLLNILSYSLMNYYNYFMYNKPTNIKLKNSNNYILFKKTVSLWFKLCLKHNMRLSFYVNKNKKNFLYDFIYVNSKNIKPITNFNNFLTPPKICGVVNSIFHYIHCKNYL